MTKTLVLLVFQDNNMVATGEHKGRVFRNVWYELENNEGWRLIAVRNLPANTPNKSVYFEAYFRQGAISSQDQDMLHNFILDLIEAGPGLAHIQHLTSLQRAGLLTHHQVSYLLERIQQKTMPKS